ncbi:MAG TPA: ABC transporter substrate binding protein [Terriglobales bacterium]|jgi:PAS domain S-box-containing protein|nr:ABC transporter substrate binding protein [Terriglobales bacterium]
MREARAITVGQVARWVRLGWLTAHSLPTILIFVAAAICPLSFAADAPSPKNVLVLYSFSDPGLFDPLDPLQAAVRRHVQSPVNFQVEYLESERFENADYEKSLIKMLHSAYGSEKLDVIVVEAYPALHFALSHRSDIFPGVPIVFYDVNATRIQGQKLPPGVTGVTSTTDVRGSIELAFRLHPDTKNVALVTGKTELERYWSGIFHNEFLRYENRAHLIELTGLPTDPLIKEASELPPHTVVFYQVIPQLSAQPILGTSEAMAAIAQNFPTYCIVSSYYCIDHGAIGGSFSDDTEQSAMEADVISRILLGEKPENIPVVHVSGPRAIVDWRQLRRWHVPESALPAGTLVLYREPTVWTRYRKLILGGIMLLALQALLICCLLWQRANKEKIARSLVQRLAFEQLIADLSTTLINVPEEQVGTTIEGNLARIAEFLDVERISLHEYSGDRQQLTVTISWHAKGVNTVLEVVAASQFPWSSKLLLRGDLVLASDLSDLPEEAAAEREYFGKLRTASAATVPLKAGSEVFGCVSFSSTNRHVLWTEALVQQLKILAEILSNALIRKRSTQALITSNTELKRADAVLRESEDRFRRVANTAPVLIWMSDTDKRCSFFNRGWLNFTGRSLEDELGEGWLTSVHPEDVHRRLEIYCASFDARIDFEIEYRLRRADGEYRWIVDYGVPRYESDGAFCGYIGSSVDITERKSSAEALRDLSGHMIHAHEEERARIARELHDDFSQRLALQCIDLEQLRKKLRGLDVEEQARLLKMLNRTKAMSADIRALSHQLHSSILELVGLVPAIGGLCEEIGEKFSIEVQFIEHGLPVDIPKDVALCLFRVTQEALGNVVKHSQAKNAQVELTVNANRVSLHITDEGRGFDPHGANPRVGLGLVGMTERLRLVGGTILIRSASMKGVEIFADVPLAVAENDPHTKTRIVGGIE